MSRSPLDGFILGLTWIVQHLEEFAIAERFDLSSPNLKDEIAQLKPLSELALTVWLLERCKLSHEVLPHISNWIWQQTDSGKLLVKLLIARNDFLPCCALYAPLYRLGHRSHQLETVLALLSGSDMAKVLPLSPWSRLALDYNLSQVGLGAPPELSARALYISALPEPWVVSGEVAYAITHEAFYLTDFGFREIENTDVVEYLTLWIPYWAQTFAREGDYDITGEFAMVWRCLRLENSLTRENPLSALLLAQTDSGYVQGPVGAGTILYRQSDTPGRRTFLARYHTTLVALMAYALALSPLLP